jgi:hypothetical protein
VLWLAEEPTFNQELLRERKMSEMVWRKLWSNNTLESTVGEGESQKKTAD